MVDMGKNVAVFVVVVNFTIFELIFFVPGDTLGILYLIIGHQLTIDDDDDDSPASYHHHHRHKLLTIISDSHRTFQMTQFKCEIDK